MDHADDAAIRTIEQAQAIVNSLQKVLESHSHKSQTIMLMEAASIAFHPLQFRARSLNEGRPHLEVVLAADPPAAK